MTLNISARNFSLTINGINRTANVLDVKLSQNELGDGGVFISGSILLQANYSEITQFTYLASPSIGANWARGALIVYQVANDSGTLVNHVLAGGALYILKEPAPPNANYQISLDIGDEATLKNYRSSDIDVSKVIPGVVTARDIVISRYLNAAFIGNTISSIPYPFVFPQPKTEGNSLADVAAKMARASNHILYSDATGRLVNKAIDLKATAIATYRISVDEQLFDQVDSSGIETPVDQLIISGIKTSIESINYPKTTVNIIYGNIKFVPNQAQMIAIGNFTLGDLVNVKYIQKRTTVTDYGWNGAEEKTVILVESSTLSISYLERLLIDPAFFLQPISETTEFNRYDRKGRLITKLTKKDSFIRTLSAVTNQTVFTNVLPVTFSNQRISDSDETKTYIYDNFDVLQSIRTETQQYIILSNALSGNLTESFYGKTAKVESWHKHVYSIENLYKPATLRFGSIPRLTFGNDIPSLIAIEGDWESVGSEVVYATDGSTKPPSTTYRKPYEPIEEQINVKLKALPFAGQSFYARSRPVEVAYLESKMQATEYGNVYLALLYGRKQGFIFGTALSNTLLSITPLSRINILWRGIRYECISDGLSWSHTLTEMAIGMRLIVLNTALESDPPTTSYPAIIASAIIEGIATQIAIATCDVSALDFVGGTAQQLAFASCFVQAGVLIQGTAKQIATASCTVTVLLPNMIARQIATATAIVNLSTWTFANVSTQLWLDSVDTATITQSSGVVSQWNDKSGNSRNATQPTFANRAILTSSGLNSTDVITFDGVNDYFEVNLGAISQPYMVFFCGRANDNTAGGSISAPYIFDSKVGESTRTIVTFNPNGTSSADNGKLAIGVIPNIITTSVATSYNAPTILAIVFDGASSYIYSEGSLSLSGTLATGSLTKIILGQRQTLDSAVTTLNGYFADFAIIAGNNSAIRQKAEGYLAHKRGLTANLPSDHPYKTTPPPI